MQPLSAMIDSSLVIDLASEHLCSHSALQLQAVLLAMSDAAIWYNVSTCTFHLTSVVPFSIHSTNCRTLAFEQLNAS